jgi:hypothetical protein
MKRLQTLACSLAFSFACSCTSGVSPGDTTELAAISGYGIDDPRVTYEVAGRTVVVKVRTYGAICDMLASTKVLVQGRTATVTPYNTIGGCSERALRVIEHTATVAFQTAGQVSIEVRGVDVGTRSTARPRGDTITVTREFTVP